MNEHWGNVPARSRDLDPGWPLSQGNAAPNNHAPRPCDAHTAFDQQGRFQPLISEVSGLWIGMAHPMFTYGQSRVAPAKYMRVLLHVISCMAYDATPRAGPQPWGSPVVEILGGSFISTFRKFPCSLDLDTPSLL